MARRGRAKRRCNCFSRWDPTYGLARIQTMPIQSSSRAFWLHGILPGPTIFRLPELSFVRSYSSFVFSFVPLQSHSVAGTAGLGRLLHLLLNSVIRFLFLLSSTAYLYVYACVFTENSLSIFCTYSNLPLHRTHSSFALKCHSKISNQILSNRGL